MPRTLREKALLSKRESKSVDFKATIDLDSTRDRVEIVKDIVAMANSGGGVIVFGVSDDGSPAALPLPVLDPAKITDQVAKYTGVEFSDFEITPDRRDESDVLLLVIEGAETPLVFHKPGTYPVAGGKQETAFGKGTVYFRHGAKSEPGTTADLQGAINRAVDEQRRKWNRGIRKVLTAPKGAQIEVVDGGGRAGIGTSVPARVVVSADAPAVARIENADGTWPHRQADVINRVNAQIGRKAINGYDIQCVRKIFDLERRHPEFVYKPFAKSSPQYSDAFVDWLIQEYAKDEQFFGNLRQRTWETDHGS